MNAAMPLRRPGFDYDVLIVGAGPVGLSLATELALRGVRALLVEQNARTGQQPRAKTTNVRSMEHMRRWGLAERIREAAPFGADYPTDIIFKTRLFGEHLATIENAFYGQRRDKDPRFSEAAQWIPQYKVEAVLRRHVDSQPGVQLRFGCRLERLEETADGVAATLLDLASGERTTVRVRYAVGADGARSVVRGMIGAEMEGRHAMAQHVGLVIRAPGLRAVMEQTPAIMYWLVNADTPVVSSPMDTGDVWTFGFTAAHGATVDDAEIHRRIDAAYGRPTEAEILTKDVWAAHSLIANRYATARIFLIGDACHLHPPFGGYGMNLGIADAVDLGWKLAAVLHGWGGPALLASYEAERRPVHRRVIEEAVANYAVLPQHLVTAELEAAGAPGEAARRRLGARIHVDKDREFHTLGVVLGYNYAGSPIVVADGTEPPREHYTDFQQSAHPGCLAPHCWLDDGRSLYDLFGRDFTLLVTGVDTGEDFDDWVAAANDRGMGLAVIQPGVDGLDALYAAQYALVRPDQHVAWRGDRMPADPGVILDIARGATSSTAAPRQRAAVLERTR